MVAIPDSSINWEYVAERVRRFSEKHTDDLLYRIGSHPVRGGFDVRRPSLRTLLITLTPVFATGHNLLSRF